MLQQMLDLGGEIESECREAAVHFTHDAERVAGTIEKIGVSEGDVRGPELDLQANVFQHQLFRQDEKAAGVYRGDRTMTAEVQAAAAGLHVARPISLSMHFQEGVSVEGFQAMPA